MAHVAQPYMVYKGKGILKHMCVERPVDLAEPLQCSPNYPSLGMVSSNPFLQTLLQFDDLNTTFCTCLHPASQDIRQLVSYRSRTQPMTALYTDLIQNSSQLQAAAPPDMVCFANSFTVGWSSMVKSLHLSMAKHHQQQAKAGTNNHKHAYARCSLQAMWILTLPR